MFGKIKVREIYERMCNIVNSFGWKLSSTDGERKRVNSVLRTHRIRKSGKVHSVTHAHWSGLLHYSRSWYVLSFLVATCHAIFCQPLLLFPIFCLHYCYFLCYILPLILAMVYFAIRCYYLCYIVPLFDLGTIIPFIYQLVLITSFKQHSSLNIQLYIHSIYYNMFRSPCTAKIR
jgi:hypothetical protein